MENLEQYLKFAKGITISSEDYIHFMDLVQESAATEDKRRIVTAKNTDKSMDNIEALITLLQRQPIVAENGLTEKRYVYRKWEFENQNKCIEVLKYATVKSADTNIYRHRELLLRGYIFDEVLENYVNQKQEHGISRTHLFGLSDGAFFELMDNLNKNTKP